MTIKIIWRDRDVRQHFFSMLLIIAIITLFWVFLYVGISSEVERRSDIPRATKNKWMQERAVNQWETEQKQPELMKAMRQAVARGKK